MPQNRETLPTPNDAELVRRMAAGDREAFATLFERHQRTVYRFALQMTGLADVAEDITQDVFMVLARRSREYDPQAGALTTYLYGIARHRVWQRDRRRRVRGETDLATVGDDDLVVRPHDPTDGLAHAARLSALRRALLRLPAHHREVIVLCELNGVSYEDAAVIVGCPVGTVRSRLSRGRRQLADRCRADARAEEEGAAARLAQWRRYARLA